MLRERDLNQLMARLGVYKNWLWYDDIKNGMLEITYSKFYFCKKCGYNITAFTKPDKCPKCSSGIIERHITKPYVMEACYRTGIDLIRKFDRGFKFSISAKYPGMTIMEKL